jgi:hypothetical protein
MLKFFFKKLHLFYNKIIALGIIYKTGGISNIK